MGFLKSLYSFVREKHPKKCMVAAALFGWWLWKRSLKEKDVQEKVVLIAGGASGVGSHVAKLFAKRGAKIVIWDDSDEKVQELGKELSDSGCHVWTFSLDVCNRTSVAEAAKRVREQIGPVDILVNNTSRPDPAFLENIPDARIIKSFNRNVLSHFWMLKECLPSMLLRGEGHLVTISTTAGLTGVEQLTDYSASNFAAVGLMESLRRELKVRGATGIFTTCVCVKSGCTKEEAMAEKIVHAVLTNETFVVIPCVQWLFPLMKLLFPTVVVDRVLHAIKAKRDSE